MWAAVKALVTAGLVTLRLASDKPLEGTGAMLNRIFLGDLDDEARAKMATRQKIQGDADLARIIGQEGGANSQIASVANDLFALAKRRELGRSLLEEEFPANGLLDMLIVRARDAFMRAWNGSGGPQRVEKFRAKYLATINSAIGGPGR